MRIAALLALALVLIVLFPCLPSVAAQPVRVGVYNTAPMSLMENGQATGFTIDLLKDLAEREHWELVFVPGTWNECLSRLRSGEIDLLPNISQTREREQEFRFSREYLLLDWVRVYRRQGLAINTLFDLEGKTITALTSSNFTEALRTLLDQFGIRATIVTKPEYAEVLAAVGRGEADAGICPGILGSLLEQTYAVRPTDIIFSPTKIRCAVKIGGREALLAALDRHLAGLKARPGSLYYQLRQKWLGVGGEPMLPGWARWAIGLGLAALGLLAAFVLFLRLLVKRRTAELGASEAKYRNIVETANEGIWMVDAQYGTTYVNAIMAAMLGHRPEDMLGRAAMDFMYPEDLPAHAGMAEHRQRGQDEVYERRFRHKDGHEVWTQVSAKSLLDAQGLFAGAMAMVTDITARKRAEQALRESEQHFRVLADNGQALIWTSTPDKLCNYFNRPWLAFTGRSLEQELGNGWAEGVHPDDFARCLEIYAAAFDARESFSMEYRLRHASGEYHWIVDQGTPRYDSQGEFLGYIGHCLDVNDRKRTEEDLRQGQRFTRAVMENLPLGIALNSVDPTVRFDYMNDNFPRLYRTTRERLSRPDGFWDAAYEDPVFREEMRRRVLDDCASGDPERMFWADVPITRQGEPTSYVSARNTPLPEHGLVISTVWDVTQRKEAETALLAAKNLAESASRAKSEFLANMSHELRTPMNGVLGMLQLLMMEELSAGQQEYAHKAFESAHRLLSLLNDVLDFSRIEAGVLAFRQEPFQVGDILAATADVFGHICARKGLALHIKADPGLPAAMLGDEARIRQIVFNLVGNAVKFTMQGEVSVEAWHRDRQGARPGSLYITVADTGVGIPEAKLDSVFDRFSQADSSYTRSFEGAGLGLAIVRRIVEALGGSLCIDSEVGQGTSVTLALSAPVAQPEAMGRPGDAAPGVEEAMPLRILLAEDELIGQMGARIMLERMGHAVVAVSDGRAAVEAVLTGSFDCVLMDIQMPEMDGLEATRIIRSLSAPEKSRVPIVAMTAYALSGDREKFLVAGMDDYIAKPFEREELRQALLAVGRRLRQGARR